MHDSAVSLAEEQKSGGAAVHHTLEALEKCVVLAMCANPKPVNFIRITEAQRTIANTDPYRIHWLALTDTLKFETRVIGIHLPDSVRTCRLFLYAYWHTVKQRAEALCNA